jgi:penicillin-binding protein 1C
VSVRKALQSSLNVPAIAVLDAVRSSRFTARLTQAGGQLILPEGEVPGLAMGLGGVGIRLTDLTMLYAGIARLGNTITLTERLDGRETPVERRLLEPAAAWQVGNVLIGTVPPLNAAPGRIAYKTGTSYGYRDAWSVGFDGKRTVGVWVGRPDGAPVPGMLGRLAAAPILFDAFARMGRLPAALPPAPRGTLIATADKLPPPLRNFRAEGDGERGASSLKIVFPPNGARLDLAAGGGTFDPIALKIAGGSGALTVLANGIPVTTSTKRTLFWAPDGPGFVRLTVTDTAGAAESVVVRVQ